MKHYRVAVRCVLATIALLSLAGTVTAGNQVPFKVILEGEFTISIDQGPPRIGTLEGSGIGQATQLGEFTYEFPHTVDFSKLPPEGKECYVFTAANGDTLTAEFTGFSDAVAPGFVLVTEEATITDGTGRFAGAKGKFTIVRLVDQINGTTSGTFEGTITKSKGKKK